jgi:hypothetical protein
MSKLRVARQNGKPLDSDARARLRAEVERDGIRIVATRLGVAPNTVTRALAALGIYPGTAILIEQRLEVARSKS